MGNRVDFIGIPLDNLSMSETLDKIEDSILNNKQIHHCVINAGKVVKMQKYHNVLWPKKPTKRALLSLLKKSIKNQ